MNVWINVYLGAFLVGFISIAGMLLLGGLHHVTAHGDAGPGSLDAQAHAAGHAHGGAAHTLWSFMAPFLNLASCLALLMCAGGLGYLALAIGAGRAVSLVAAAAGGLGGAWLMATATRLLIRAEAGRVLANDPRGTVARVIAPIAVDRIGEIVFCREDGGRQALPARLDHGGRPIERDAQVVVMRVERGIAYVERVQTLPEKESATWTR